MVPSSTVQRQKRGFGAPVESWLRRELRPAVHELLLSPEAKLSEFFFPRPNRQDGRGTRNRKTRSRTTYLGLVDARGMRCAENLASFRHPRPAYREILSSCEDR